MPTNISMGKPQFQKKRKAETDSAAAPAPVDEGEAAFPRGERSILVFLPCPTFSVTTYRTMLILTSAILALLTTRRRSRHKIFNPSLPLHQILLRLPPSSDSPTPRRPLGSLRRRPLSQEAACRRCGEERRPRRKEGQRTSFSTAINLAQIPSQLSPTYLSHLRSHFFLPFSNEL